MRQGRFEKELNEAMRQLNASISYDRRLFEEDIRGSLAWAAALRKSGVLSSDDEKEIQKGLAEIRTEILEGKFEFSRDLEDIHMNIESRLIEKIGPAGARLHTGRSRNDQVACDLRMYLRAAAEASANGVEELIAALVATAERTLGVIVPAYTHLQRAQPVLFSHHLLAYAEMLRRDRQRFDMAAAAANISPLGSGACVGNQFGVDREFLAKELGFSGVTRNSMDGVSDRDFVADYLYASSMLMVHLSRFSEDLILWASQEFRLVSLDESVTTGSSMLPQKRNPDAAELTRGKCGRIAGRLLGLLATLKGLPLTYNKDLQEDKEAVFDAVDTLELILPVVRVMVETLEVDRERAGELLQGGHLEAISAADYLVRKEMPFREAHDVVGRLVRRADEVGTSLTKLDIEEYRKLSSLFDEDVFEAIGAEGAVGDKQVTGGTAPDRVREEIARWKKELSQ